MNETVAKLLNNRLATLEDAIKWERDTISRLIQGQEESGKRLDQLTAERRSIADHLTMNGVSGE